MSNVLRSVVTGQLSDHLREAQRLTAALSVKRDTGPKLNLARLISELSTGHVYGEDREAIEEYSRQAGITSIDPQRPFLPFALFRDLNKATPSAGGYLVSAEVPEAVDILRPWSVTARAGLMIETGLVGDQAVPRVSATSTAYWLSTEATELTASAPTLAQIAMAPKNVGATINFSRQLAKQANADKFVRRELMKTVGTAVDQAVINGSGAAGQPTGLLQTSGIGSTSGTTITHDTIGGMKQTVAEANAPDEAISFIATPAVRKLLENRERSTGSGFIWDKDQVSSRPAYVSTDIPTATMICGAWEAAYLGIWGEGFTVEVNPYDPTGFKSGQIQARILVSCDIAILHAAAFNAATSIT